MNNTIKYNGKLNAIGNKIKDYRIKNKNLYILMILSKNKSQFQKFPK